MAAPVSIGLSLDAREEGHGGDDDGGELNHCGRLVVVGCWGMMMGAREVMMAIREVA